MLEHADVFISYDDLLLDTVDTRYIKLNTRVVTFWGSSATTDCGYGIQHYTKISSIDLSEEK